MAFDTMFGVGIVTVLFSIASPVPQSLEERKAGVGENFVAVTLSQKEAAHAVQNKPFGQTPWIQKAESINQCYDRVKNGCRAKAKNTRQYNACIDKGFKYCEQNNR